MFSFFNKTFTINCTKNLIKKYYKFLLQIITIFCSDSDLSECEDNVSTQGKVNSDYVNMSLNMVGQHVVYRLNENETDKKLLVKNLC